jgi:6-pyruvoyltetrahydropterin/6-carboxytetrahydropterin synthase
MITRVTKIFSFEAAHRLPNHSGKCKNLHGHSYKLEVTVIGEAKKQKNVSDEGMVIDFGELSKIIKTHVVDVYDHALLTSETHSFGELKVVYFSFAPTCEILLEHIVTVLLEIFSVSLICVKLWETETSYCTWYADDN